MSESLKGNLKVKANDADQKQFLITTHSLF